MAEDIELPESGSGGDAAAISLALTGASRGSADAYLEDQRKHLHEQMKQIHLGIWEKQLGVALRLATMVVGCLFAGALGYMVWDASRANGLKVEPFSVPPDLAARGMTGEVVAARVIDRLSELQSQTNTQRPARSYSNAWGGKAIKLEIPETGVSLEELDSWLREKLGRETLLTGEIVRTKDGVTVTARAGEDGAQSISGPDADIDVLVNRLAEAIYRLTQPYRYAAYLYRHENRPADALPIFKDLTLTGSPDDKLWSYNMWAQTAATVARDNEVALRMYREALAADPDAIGVYTNLAPTEANLGLWETALQTRRQWHEHLNNGRQRYVPADLITISERRGMADLNTQIGAYHDSAPANEEMRRDGVPGFPLAAILNRLVNSRTGEHDLSGARAALVDFPAGPNADALSLRVAFAAGDWRAALGLGDLMAAWLKANPPDRRYAIAAYSPALALAQAHLSDFAAAERSIAPTRGDCYPCLIARAQIAELQGQRARADFWFTRATDAGPSLAFAFETEGRVLLTRGKPDDAIQRFVIANQKSPHFADALQGWGEALMAKNQSHLALAKFAEAEKYAPNWGRLHLKWGEALTYVGKRDETKTHFARAVQLDLTPDEKAELQKYSANHT